MPQNKAGVLCVGDINADINIDRRAVKTVTQSAEDLMRGGSVGNKGMLCPGGTAANTAVGLGRLGTRVAIAGLIGADGFGQFSIDHLEKDGVDTSHLVRLPGGFTMVTVNIFDQNGDRELSFAFPEQGAAFTLLTPDHLPDALLAQFSVFYTTGVPILFDPTRSTLIDCMHRCHKLGVTVAFDLNMRVEAHGYTDDIRRAFEQAAAASDILFGSATQELPILTGCTDWVQAAQKLRRSCRVVVSKNGAAGAAVFGPGESCQMPAFPVSVKDTLGAGDAFNAGFLTAYVQNKSLRDCLLWGSAAAGYSIQFTGSRTTPNSRQLAAFMAEHADIAAQIGPVAV